MANSILVTATQRGSGKSTVALGLVNQLEGSIPRVGYFKPIGMAGPNGVEPDVQLMKEALGLPFSVEEMVPTTMDQVQEALSNNSFDSLLDKILEAYEHIAKECDFVVCEGTDYLGAMAAFEFNINADISKNLGAPILLVANAQDCKGNLGNGCQFCESMIEHIVLAKESFDEKSCEVFGVIVNRVEQVAMKDIEKMARAGLKKVGIRLLGTLPKADMLSKLRVEEIADALGAEVLSGKDRMAILAQEIVVAAMNVENALERMPRGSLVLTPGDQNGMLLGLAAAFMSPAVPAPAGVLITGGMAPNPKVKEIFIDVTNGRLPLMQVDTPTYETALRISQIEPRLAANQKLRIEVTKTLIDQNVNIEPLLARSAVEPSNKNLTPKQFIHKMMSLARSNPKRIVLPEGKEERILKAAHVLLHRGIVKLTLLGKEDQIQRQLARIGLTLEGDYEIIDPETSELRAKFAKRYQELRAPKHHPTDETAFERMGEPAYFGTMMVQEGLADGMVSGSITTTAATLRPALEFVKTKPGCSIASSVFFMCLPNQVLVYGDCAVNPNPTAEMLADIALASAETASSFGVDPYVAMLSYSTGASGKGSDVEKVRAATEIVKKTNPELPVEGPIQYDAAVDPGVAKTKLPDSRVAGAATVMIFPDLNTGNNTYKAVQRSANAIAIGPVMQGLNKPVNDLSRGCTIPDIINTVAITAIQAQRS